jgi:solute carrier family 4 (sodium borate transporter), member 11
MFGGIIYSLLGGQPMVVLMTTAPIALYIKAINSVCEMNGYDFGYMYAWVGIFAAIFLFLSSIFNASTLLNKYSTLFTEETFALFVVVAYGVYSIIPLVTHFDM